MGRKKYIDQIDINLLNTLKAFPTYSIAELGKVVDLTPGPTHTRLTKLRKQGFFSEDFKINYTKFGLEKKICMFEIKLHLHYCKILNQGQFIPDIIRKLSNAKTLIVDRIERVNDEEYTHWYMINFYPLVNEKHNFGGYGKRREYKYESEIQDLLHCYLHLGVKYFHVNQMGEANPELTAKQRMKNEPPQ